MPCDRDRDCDCDRGSVSATQLVIVSARAGASAGASAQCCRTARADVPFTSNALDRGEGLEPEVEVRGLSTGSRALLLRPRNAVELAQSANGRLAAGSARLCRPKSIR